ncbi:pentapeptide repeat-containing protein [Streptomyces microflavus]|uniref:pentapeptide repeat-containing protein n=1 Tax=Streptomyces microflavus TaxID=1919 RepID=UPI003320B3CF
MSTPEPPPPPPWPHCAHGAHPDADPVGCRGIHVSGHTACLAHLTDTDRVAYLAGLAPGADIDHRGTTFTDSLLHDLQTALEDPATGTVHFSNARFESATFKHIARFQSATFHGDARFESATFKHTARFQSATFHGDARFQSATFHRDARFQFATFKHRAAFMSATFHNGAGFQSATFHGTGRFNSATFERNAGFEAATFEDNTGFELATFKRGGAFVAAIFKRRASFVGATFHSRAAFESATFLGRAWFEAATFERNAEFKDATFEREAGFEAAAFHRGARFESATFTGNARFGLVTFMGNAGFEAATFTGDALFDSATFEKAHRLGPLACAGQVVLSSATFGGPVTLWLAARRLECRRTRWAATAEIRLRYTTVDFAHAVFEYPLTIAAEPDPFVLTDGSELAETAFAGAPGPDVRLASLRGVDAAHLVLADVDLSPCLFTGTVHLDQLRLEGACTFDTTPSPAGWRRWLPVRFTRRRVLAEEHHWRARRPGAMRGWNVAVLGAGRVGPLQLAPVYRALRKAFEDGKHEPGAADFYYGEMEMRRHADDIPRSERGLLTAYWALSGYGLRASRALAWLGAGMLLTIGLLMAFGIAQDTPKQTATGTVPPGGGTVTFEIDKDDPKNPISDRLSGERFEKALNVTLNSVVFRSSGQDLTTAGTYIEMASRLTEPVLLGLAVLAIRNRVKR